MTVAETGDSRRRSRGRHLRIRWRCWSSSRSVWQALDSLVHGDPLPQLAYFVDRTAGLVGSSRLGKLFNRGGGLGETVESRPAAAALERVGQAGGAVALFGPHPPPHLRAPL